MVVLQIAVMHRKFECFRTYLDVSVILYDEDWFYLVQFLPFHVSILLSASTVFIKGFFGFSVLIM